jgi:hypothetical protein
LLLPLLWFVGVWECVAIMLEVGVGVGGVVCVVVVLLLGVGAVVGMKRRGEISASDCVVICLSWAWKEGEHML